MKSGILQKIREAFSKGTVITSSDGVTVFYTYRERWFSQSISDESKRVFQDLIGASDKFGIDYKAGKFIKLVFRREIDGETVVMYQPLTEEISIEEMQAIIESEEPNEDFFEFMDGSDLKDDDDACQRLLEWVKMVDERDRPEEFHGDWQAFEEKALRFARYCTCGCEVVENEAIELQFPEGKRKPFWIEGDEKGNLQGLMEISSCVGIEGYVPDGFLNITFFC